MLPLHERYRESVILISIVFKWLTAAFENTINQESYNEVFIA